MKAKEFNFDGLVGPTHNYSGLSKGNIASTSHAHMVSSPKKASLQGLQKMKFLHDLGIPQAVLPPQDRPHIPTLRTLGFEGSDADVLHKAFKFTPALLFRCSSASSMWAANVATVTPSCDTATKQVHFTPANLTTMFHRSIEAPQTFNVLAKIFANRDHFVIHHPLPCGSAFSDEGAANHTPLCSEYGKPGLHLFTYGRSAFQTNSVVPMKYPARQTLEACETLARTHGILHNRAIFLQQTPEAIDAGVFHNDVIAVGDRNLFFFHEKAYVNQKAKISLIKELFDSECKRDLKCIEIKESDLSLEDAVNSYFFNSQIVHLPDGKTALICPIECRDLESTRALLEKLKEQKYLDYVHFIDVRESMSNGGGPGCLRLRVCLTEAESAAIHQGIIFTDELYLELVKWVEKYFRDALDFHELADPQFLIWNREALDALSKILKLGSIYSFQH